MDSIVIEPGIRGLLSKLRLLGTNNIKTYNRFSVVEKLRDDNELLWILDKDGKVEKIDTPDRYYLTLRNFVVQVRKLRKQSGVNRSIVNITTIYAYAGEKIDIEANNDYKDPEIIGDADRLYRIDVSELEEPFDMNNTELGIYNTNVLGLNSFGRLYLIDKEGHSYCTPYGVMVPYRITIGAGLVYNIKLEKDTKSKGYTISYAMQLEASYLAGKEHTREEYIKFDKHMKIIGEPITLQGILDRIYYSRTYNIYALRVSSNILASVITQYNNGSDNEKRVMKSKENRVRTTVALPHTEDEELTTADKLPVYKMNSSAYVTYSSKMEWQALLVDLAHADELLKLMQSGTDNIMEKLQNSKYWELEKYFY